MSEFPSLPLFTDAFIADTGHLNAHETGAYLMLLMIAWRLPECRLPDDDIKLARWARVSPQQWTRTKPKVMEFWTLEAGHWTQKRLASERFKVRKFAAVARQNGLLGGRPKSLENQEVVNPAGFIAGTQEKPKHNHPNPNPNPNPNSKQEGSLRSLWSFEEFWRVYPHKIGKRDALKAFDVAKRSEFPFEGVKEAIQRYIREKPPDRPYCNPATWLRQGRWDDQPALQTNGTGNGTSENPNSVVAASQRLLDKIRSWDAPSGGDSTGGGTRGPPVRLLSQG